MITSKCADIAIGISKKTHRESPANEEGSRSRPKPSARHSLSRWTDETWEEIALRVFARCHARLASRSGIDPWEPTQEVMVSLQRRDFANRFDPSRSSLWTYVGGIVRNECARAIRQAVRHQHASESYECLVEAPSSNPVLAAEQQELREALAAVTALLTPAERAALPRLIERARSGPLTGVSNSTMHVREFRCRARLRELLKGHW